MLLILAIICLFQSILNLLLYKAINNSPSKIVNKLTQVLSQKGQVINPTNILDEIKL